MELYKLRYKLYDFLIDNDINYSNLVSAKNIGKYFIITIFIFFIIITVVDTSKISFNIILFILFGIIFIYLTFILDNKLAKIFENKDFINYTILFKLFNIIFIDSYNSNNIPTYINSSNILPQNETLTTIVNNLKNLSSTNRIRDRYYKELTSTSITFGNNILNEQEKNYIKSDIINTTRFIGGSTINNNIEENIIEGTDYYYIKFKSGSTSVNVLNNITVDILIVGGGGSGGYDGGGGGGGGEVKYITNYTLVTNIYTFIIGEGGSQNSQDGNNTIIRNDTTDIIIAGGGGGGGNKGYSGKTGTGGGGGGGGHENDLSHTGGIPTSPSLSGYGAGGRSTNGGGGGGGYNIPNKNGTSGTDNYGGIAGNGGSGIDIDINGINIGYGGGGAGGNYNSDGGSATHGGGAGGGISRKNGINGIPNTGGGGGGSGNASSDSTPAGTVGLGGSGVIIIKINKDDINSLEYNYINDTIENNIIQNTDNYYIKFKSGITYLNIVDDINIDILVIGGGGGGGNKAGSGGGAGTLIYKTNYHLIAGNYTIIIGTGGHGGIGGLTNDFGNNGGDTHIIKDQNSIFLAKGGGGGSGGGVTELNPIRDTNKDGNDGGSGGGGYKGGRAGRKVSNNKPQDNDVFGNDGASSTSSVSYGGGGGGAGGPGIPGAIGTVAQYGNGGLAKSINITGKLIYYAGGGGAGNRVDGFFCGYGGLGASGTSTNPITNGGAGDGGSGHNSGGNARPNTGSGGGGGGYDGIVGVSVADAGSGGNGGSGVVIMRMNKYNNKITVPTTITSSNPITIYGYNIYDISIRKYNSRYYILILGYNDINNYRTDNSKRIKEFLDNHYLNFSNIIIKIDNNDINGISYIYVIDLIEYESYKINNKNSKIFFNIYNLIKEYFYNIETYDTHTPITDTKLTGLLTSEIDNKNYINTFYTTLIQINKNINYFENISNQDIYNQTTEYINNLNLLKFIDIYDNDRYLILKKYIFIKIDNSNELHNYIKNNYDDNKTKKISLLNNDSGILISDIIKDVSGLYLDTNPVYNTKIYFMIDIETINKFINENKNNLNSINVNSYILKIYEDLLLYYNNKINLKNTIDNFDLLFKETKIDKKIKEMIDDYTYIYNLIIIIYIILMTIILHIFYIQLFRYL